MSGYGAATVVRLGPVVDVLTTEEGTVALVEREVGHQVERCRAVVTHRAEHAKSPGQRGSA